MISLLLILFVPYIHNKYFVYTKLQKAPPFVTILNAQQSGQCSIIDMQGEGI